MSADGTKVLDDGKTIVDEPQHLPTLEGPKLYKRDGFYYIFAPFGGVGTGAETVLRSKNIYGPYEFRTVLEQGSTGVNGPHQGGWVETPSGQSWFMHFSQHDGYGRILYLEPVAWKDGWPVIGAPIAGSTAGQPVTDDRKPDVGRAYSIQIPQTSDEFNAPRLGLQWEWNHNPDDGRWSLTDHPGFLRLKASYASDLFHARNTLTQQMEEEAMDFTVRIDVGGMRDGQQAGVAMFGFHPAWIGVEQKGGHRQIVYSSNSVETAGPALTNHLIVFRLHISMGMVSFAYSLDNGRNFTNDGGPDKFYMTFWKAARPALFSFNTSKNAPEPGWIDVDWAHVQAATAQ
jgi:beta-xylosidase